VVEAGVLGVLADLDQHLGERLEADGRDRRNGGANEPAEREREGKREERGPGRLLVRVLERVKDG
jgi:hypothetical protein